VPGRVLICRNFLMRWCGRLAARAAPWRRTLTSVCCAGDVQTLLSTPLPRYFSAAKAKPGKKDGLFVLSGVAHVLVCLPRL
jgi:hypothetical protein